MKSRDEELADDMVGEILAFVKEIEPEDWIIQMFISEVIIGWMIISLYSFWIETRCPRSREQKHNAFNETIENLLNKIKSIGPRFCTDSNEEHIDSIKIH